jgi:mono/diheme cytochrome c family protein
MVLAIAVVAVSAAPASSRLLAAELLIVRGDLGRLASEPGLSPANREGLRQRIVGALGLLPWLLREAGDAAEADRLRAWQGGSFSDVAARDALIAAIDAAIARHPIDRSAFFAPQSTTARLSEARSIHATYCAACHDGMGTGASDALLPARDLFAMAQQESADEFLARMVNGVKGDEAIHFANPLTDAQIGALCTFYRTRAP